MNCSFNKHILTKYKILTNAKRQFPRADAEDVLSAQQSRTPKYNFYHHWGPKTNLDKISCKLAEQQKETIRVQTIQKVQYHIRSSSAVGVLILVKFEIALDSKM